MKAQFTIIITLLAASMACVGIVSADETISGQLTVDQDSVVTALVVRGGTSGRNLAEFVRDNGTDSDPVARVSIFANANDPQMQFYDYTDAGVWSLGLKSSDNSFRINQHSRLFDQLNNYFVIDNTGKVILSAGKLVVDGAFQAGPGVLAIGLQTDTYEGGELILKSNAAYDASFRDWHLDSFHKFFRIFNSNGAMFTMDHFGNVGIGVTPQNKLDVNGTIRAKEIIVESDWADFVFEDDYKLPSLQEVEAHIKEFGHLPDIPTENDVQEQGVSLGEMNARLLQKVEELTLYTLDQEERLQKQDALIEKLVTRLEALENESN